MLDFFLKILVITINDRNTSNDVVVRVTRYTSVLHSTHIPYPILCVDHNIMIIFFGGPWGHFCGPWGHFERTMGPVVPPAHGGTHD